MLLEAKGFPARSYESGIMLVSNEHFAFCYTVNTDGSKVLRRLSATGDIDDTIAVYPPEIIFFCDEINGNLYTISIEAGTLSFAEISGFVKHFPVATPDEFVVEVSCSNNLAFVRTAQDSEDGQIARLYFVNLDNESITPIHDEMILASYIVPHFVSCGSTTSILFEESVVFPFELAELNASVSDGHYLNRVFVTDAKDFISSLEDNANFRLSEIYTGLLSNEGYVQVLDTLGRFAYLACVDISANRTVIRKIDVIKNSIDSEIALDGTVTFIVKNHEDILGYYAWTDKRIVFFNSVGMELGTVNLEDYLAENDYLEFNDVLTCLHDRYIVFNASDYSDNEDGKQIRIIYDFEDESFRVYPYAFIAIGNDCF